MEIKCFFLWGLFFYFTIDDANVLFFISEDTTIELEGLTVWVLSIGGLLRSTLTGAFAAGFTVAFLFWIALEAETFLNCAVIYELVAGTAIAAPSTNDSNENANVLLNQDDFDFAALKFSAGVVIFVGCIFFVILFVV